MWFYSLSVQQKTRLALAAVLCLYFLFGSLYATTAPVFEKPDESAHYAYVVYLVEHGRLLPITWDPLLNPAQAEAIQPPLYYTLAAGMTRLVKLNVQLLELPLNKFVQFPLSAVGNKNVFLHEPNELARPEFWPVYALRFFSLLLGCGTVLCTYGLLRELGATTSFRLLSAALVAVHPQFLFLATSVSNDILVVLLAHAAIWALLAALRVKAQGWQWVLFGVLSGLAMLAKFNAVIIPVLGMGLAVLVGAWRRSQRMAIIGVAASLSGVLVIAGWWYLRNTLLYHDPTGLRFLGVEGPLQIGQSRTLQTSASQWVLAEASYWGVFGWGNVPLPLWAYWLVRVAEVLALIGLARVVISTGRQLKFQPPLGLLVLTLYAAGCLISYGWFVYSSGWVASRYVLVAVGPLSVLALTAWRRLRPSIPAIMLVGLGLVAAVGPVAVARAYQPPRLLGPGDAPPNAQPTFVGFSDLARLSAYGLSTHRADPGQTVTVTLCWEALATTDTNYAVFVHLLGPEGGMVGAVNTYPGLGNFPTTVWRPGDAFCDQYPVPVGSDAPGPAVYDLEVGLFNLETGERLPAADEAGNLLGLTILGKVKVLGPVAAIPGSTPRLDANFADQITLLGYDLGPVRQGRGPIITLYWQARTTVTADYTVFLHVLDESGHLVGQGDAPPQAGRYPTSWWDAGEIVVDAHTIDLPADATPGIYSIVVGWYSPQTGERLPLIGPPAGDALELGSFQLDLVH